MIGGVPCRVKPVLRRSGEAEVNAVTKSRPREKKSESIEVRLSYSEKRAFVETCRERGLTLSEALRTLMQEQSGSQRADITRMFSQWEFKMTCFASLGLATVIVLSGIQSESDAHTPLIAESFDSVDLDSDGKIDRAEYYLFVGMEPDGTLSEESREFLLARAAHLEGAPQSAAEREAVLDEELATIRAQVNEEFDRYDADGDGKISLGEFADQVGETY